MADEDIVARTAILEMIDELCLQRRAFTTSIRFSSR